MAQGSAALPRIRPTTILAKGDGLLIGNVLVAATELGAVWWEPTLGKVLVNARCHTDNILTDCTRTDWDTYLATLP